MFEFNGKQYSLEQLQAIADKKGYKFEELLAKNPTIKEIKQESPVGGFFGDQAKTNAVVEPVAPATAKQQIATNTVSTSENGSLDSQNPDPTPKRYIEFKDGTIVYEDTYIQKKAGTKGYPATFDEYAKAFNTTPKQFDSPEIVVKGTSSLALLPEMKSAWKTKVYNKEKGVFETSDFNDQLFNQEEKVVVNVFKDLYAGSNIEFEESNKITFPTRETIGTGEFGEVAFGVPGTEAVVMKVKDKKTGEYIYSKPIELETDKKLRKQYADRNSKIINDFIESNKENLDIPGWTREKNKLAVSYAQFKKQNLDPVVRKTEVLASEKFLANEDLFKPIEKYTTVPYVLQEDGTKISGSSRVLKKTIPYENEISKEIIKLKKEGFEGNDDEFNKEAQKRVRVNLYENDVNNAIYKANEDYINESDDKDKAQALLYTALIPEKNKKAIEFNETSKLTQIAIEKTKQASIDKKLILDIYSGVNKDENQVSKLEKIVKDYGVFTTSNSDLTNDPKFNAKFGLKDNANVPTNFYNLYNAIESAEKANVDLIKINSNKSDEIIGGIEDISTAMNAASRNYELLEKYGANVALGVTDIGVGIGILAGNIITLGQSEAIKKAGIDYTEFSDEIRDSYSRDVSFDDAFSTPENFGKFLGQEVSNQLPIITAMLLSGGFGGAVIGASSTGQKMMDMQYEMSTGEAQYSQAEFWLKSIGYGAAEYAFAELTTIPILKRAKNNWIGAGKEQLVNNSTKEYFKSKYKDIIYDPLLESVGEIGTTSMQNLIDGKPILDNIEHSGFSGYGFGLAFSAIPFFKGLYNSQFSTYESLTEARKLKSEINSLSNRLLNSQTGEQSDSYKRIFDLVKTKTEKLDNIIKTQEDFINNKLTSRGVKYLTDIQKKKLDLQNTVEGVIKDKNLNEFEKNEIISNAKNELNILNEYKNKALSTEGFIKNETEWEAFKALNQVKTKEYKTQAEEILIAENFGKEVKPIDINAKAYDLYFADIIKEENSKASANLFKNFKSFETVDEAIKDLDNYPDLEEKTKQAIIKGLKDGNDGYALPGKAKTQVAVIENQVKNQRKYTKTHEVGHEAFWELISRDSNNAAFSKISDQLIHTLRKTDKKVYDQFIKDGIDDDKGNILPTEVISRFLEYVSEGKITNVQKAKGISGLFGVMIQKEFNKDYNFDFRGENDMFNFAVGIGKKIKSGELSVEDIQKAKESKLISELKTTETTSKTAAEQSFSKVVEIETKIEDLNDKYYSGEIDDFDYEQQLDNLQSKLEVAKKQEVNKPVEIKKPKVVESDVKADQIGDTINKIIPKGTTKKQYDNEVIGKVAEKLVSGRTLDPLIKKIAAGYGIVSDNVYGKSWEDFYDTVKGVQLLKNLQKFNPETNDDFGGFVIGSQFGIRNRVKEALEQFKKENEGGFKEDVETAKGIISEETDLEEEIVQEKALIDPRKSRIVKDKLPEIEAEIDIDPATITTLTFKNVGEKYGGIVGAKIFNVPVKKVADPAANLTYATKIIDGVPEYSEAGNIQNAFTNPQQAKEFVKLLPEFNVAGNEVSVSETGEIIDVSESAKGYAIGVPNNLIKLMYDTYVDPRSSSESKTERSKAITSPKGRSKGLTSQATVYKLKPEFTGTISNEAIAKFQDALGITEKGKLNKYNREIGQVLKSVAKLYGSEVANVIVRDKINKSDIKTSKPKSQILADVAAGKSEVMFSKGIKLVDDFKTLEPKNIDFTNLDNVNNARRAIIDISSNFTIEEFINIFLGTAKRAYSNGRYIKYEDDKRVVSYYNEDEQRFSTRQFLFLNKKEFVETLKQAYPNDKIDVGEDGTFVVVNDQKIITTTPNQSPKGVSDGSFIKGKPNAKTTPSLEKRQEFANDQSLAIKKVAFVLKESYKNGQISADQLYMILANFNSSVDALIRTAASPTFFLSDITIKKVEKFLGRKLTDDDFIYEHTQTASDTLVEIARFITGQKDALSIDEIMNNFKVALIPKVYSNIMDKSKKKGGAGLRSNGRRRANGSLVTSSTGKIVRYEDSKEKWKEAGLPPLVLVKKIEYNPLSNNVSFSKNLSEEFNKIIENKTGIAYDKTISEVKAKMIADKKRKFDFFIPPSAEDFVGLLYYTLGKGKTGDEQMKFYKRTLLDPYARANEFISRDRNALGRRFKEIKKEFKVTPKDLKKTTPDGLFTREQAVRVWIWNSIGAEIPGLSKSDVKELVDYVNSDKNLSDFAVQIMQLNPGKKYTSPTKTWNTGTITTDLLEVLNTSRRAMHLKQWQQNVDAIFSEENLNKLEAAYGTQYRKAMENILTRMKTGRNRTYGTDTLTGRFTDWVNGSVGAIMFLNTRSAVLQTISAVNFINFSDNNILAASKALANQKQYWSDFKTLFNSEYLVDRRDGLKVNVNEADIADIAKEKGVRGALNYLLKLGFTPTQIADSFAIASGGATFYRNRVKSLIKKGMDPVAAEKLAMRDFIETAEESQQSSRPDKISQQQAGPLGRIVLAFANTPAQYARLIKKAASDLKNGRGDAKTNISKILYYGAVQNIIFNALQQAIFAMTFGDEEEEDEKTVNIINGMIDGIARGTGLGGAVFTVVKNTALKLYRDSEKKNPKYEDGFLELLKISPPISSKVQKLRSAGRTMSWEMDEIKEKGFSPASPAVKVGGKVTSALFNFPADRAVQKIENLVDASNSELETYKRLALLGGWSAWELGIKEDEKKKEKKPSDRSITRKSLINKSIIRKEIIR